MMKTFVMACLLAGAATLPVSAQERPAGPPPAQDKGAPVAGNAEAATRLAGEKRRNVSIELAIIDQTGSAEPIKKVVTMIVADGRVGSVRSSGQVLLPASGSSDAGMAARRARAGVMLNLDATPNIHSDGSVLLNIKLEYTPRPEGSETGGDVQLHEGITVTLESGKPLVISRAADPAGNRKIVVEVTGTVLK
jgi:hypothetical protein